LDKTKKIGDCFLNLIYDDITESFDLFG